MDDASAIAAGVSSADDERLRREIEAKLEAGLETEAWPRAETSEMVNGIIARLRTEAKDDLAAKLVVAGMTNRTIEAEEARAIGLVAAVVPAAVPPHLPAFHAHRNALPRSLAARRREILSVDEAGRRVAAACSGRG